MGRLRDLVKAIPTAARLAGTARDLSEQVRALTEAQRQQASQAVALPRNPAWPTTPYGPGQPIVPAPINTPRPDTGRAEPRLWQYPVTWNLPASNQRLVPWQTLRDAANGISIFRRCIEIRKDHLLGMGWDITLTQRAVETAQQTDPNASRVDVQKALLDRLGPDISRLIEFWQTPDRGNGYDWPAWLAQALEELFVLDALAIYPRRTYGGDLYALEVIDGSTVKPLLDERGGRPQPPLPAFQQILYGFPRGEFVADTEQTEQGPVVPGAFAADQLIYARRVVRTWTPYGYSPVEQALMDGDLWLKRQQWMRAEYTDGVTPAREYETPPELGWSPEQLLDYERQFNDLLAGQTAERHRARFLPPGVKVPTDNRDGLAEKYKPEYDLHLLKLVASHFDTTLPELGFTEAKGLGSSGYHEGQENVQDRKTRPLVEWLQHLLTRISRTHLGMPAELEFRFLGMDDEDEAAAVEVDRERAHSGGMTLNEWRDEQGRPRYDFPEADKPMVVTQRGVIFLEGAASVGQPGQPVGPAEPVAEGGDGEPGGQQPSGKPATDRPTADKAAELAAYRRRARKGGSRPFVFEHVTEAEAKAAGVDMTRALFKAAGDGDPKGQPPAEQWPGWQMDLAAAAVWSEALRRALTGVLGPLGDLVADWLGAAPPAHGDHQAVPNPGTWLQARGVDLYTPLADVLPQVWTEGYLIGDRAATALLTASVQVDWGDWQPGHPEAARRVLSADGLDVRLADLLDEWGVQITSIAANRLDEVAAVLADGLERGESAQAIADALRGVLDDERWAHMVAVTETTRAVSAATQDTYERNHIAAKEWLTAEDDRVCPICHGNEDEGAVPLAGLFASGVPSPPAHPNCRCALIPHLDLPDED